MAEPIIRDASEMELPAGRFPYRFTHGGIEWELIKRERDGDGDLVAVHYDSRTPGQRLIVLND